MYHNKISMKKILEMGKFLEIEKNEKKSWNGRKNTKRRSNAKCYIIEGIFDFLLHSFQMLHFECNKNVILHFENVTFSKSPFSGFFDVRGSPLAGM